MAKDKEVPPAVHCEFFSPHLVTFYEGDMLPIFQRSLNIVLLFRKL
jgi:hypothetical protein